MLVSETVPLRRGPRTRSSDGVEHAHNGHLTPIRVYRFAHRVNRLLARMQRG